MALPLVPLALVAIAAIMAANANKGSGSDTRTDPNPLFDDNLPPPMRANLEQSILAGGAWMGFFLAAYQLQNQGYPKSAATMLAIANKGRQERGLTPIPFPITPETYAQAAAESQQAASWQGVDQTVVPGVPGPGGTAYGIPPTPTATPARQPVAPHTPEETANLPQRPRIAPPPGAAPPNPIPGIVPTAPPAFPPIGVVPIPGGGVKVTVPGLGDITVPPGIMGTPPAVPPPATYNPPPGGRPPLPAPPTAYVPPPPPVQARAYPKGAGTRPDGTFGYLTQPGDVTVDIIAKKFGGGAKGAELMSANPGVEWNKNYVGSDLNLPSGWVSASSPPPARARGKVPPKKSGATISPGVTIPGMALPPGWGELPNLDPNS